jgi:ankyrin repeat protein
MKKLFSTLTTLASLIAYNSLAEQQVVKKSTTALDKNMEQVVGVNSLMSSVTNNDIEGVRFFAKSGKSLINARNFGGATSLHIACRENNSEIAKILIESGAEVNVVDNEGWTPLMRAALNGNREIVKLLIQKGASANNLNSVNESAIIHATIAECAQCLEYMFDHFDFIKSMDIKLLKEQLTDSFIIARNHDNHDIQDLLESYLDQTIKMSPLIESDKNSSQLATNAAQKETKGQNFLLKNSEDNEKSAAKNTAFKQVEEEFLDDEEETKIVDEKITVNIGTSTPQQSQTIDVAPIAAKKIKIIKNNVTAQTQARKSSAPTFKPKNISYNLIKTKEDAPKILPEKPKTKYKVLLGSASSSGYTAPVRNQKPKFRLTSESEYNIDENGNKFIFKTGAEKKYIEPVNTISTGIQPNDIKPKSTETKPTKTQEEVIPKPGAKTVILKKNSEPQTQQNNTGNVTPPSKSKTNKEGFFGTLVKKIKNTAFPEEHIVPQDKTPEQPPIQQ